MADRTKPIIVVAPGAQLTFKRHDMPGGDQAWVAEAPEFRWLLNSFLDRDFYRVFRWKDGWDVSRPKHPLLPDLHGRYKARRDAMQICVNDYAVLARLHRWIEYMKQVEPPSLTAPGQL